MKPSTKIVKLMPSSCMGILFPWAKKAIYRKVPFYLREYSLLFIYSRGEIN